MPESYEGRFVAVVLASVMPSAKKNDLLLLFWPRSAAPSAKKCDVLPLFLALK